MAETLSIQRMSYGDEAVARNADGKTVFVAGAVAGDIVEAEVVESKASFDRARVVSLLEASPLRRCPEDDRSALVGSPWAFLAYDAQLQAKHANLVSALIRTAKLPSDDAERLCRDTVPSKREWGYRNKIELNAGIGDDGRLLVGFCEPGTDAIVASDTAPLAHDAIAASPKALRGALRFLQQRGDLRLFRVGVRHSRRTGSCEVALWCEPGPCNRALVAKTIQSAIPATSVVRVLAQPGSARNVKKTEMLAGDGYWLEDLEGPAETLSFATSAPSFFQVNTPQAEVLVRLVVDALGGADAIGGMRICDLYAGGGTFGLHLAACGADVSAVESLGSSVRDLRRNAEGNGLDIDIIGGDAARELAALGPMDALVVDPPRAGLAASLIDDIANLNVGRVAYVSCDPQTLARDIVRFAAAGYAPVSITPVDMFPQTFHCETVALMAKQ